jgi:hypothetical protein
LKDYLEVYYKNPDEEKSRVVLEAEITKLIDEAERIKKIQSNKQLVQGELKSKQ